MRIRRMLGLAPRAAGPDGRVSRRGILWSATGPLLHALAPNEELVPFLDYTREFRAEMQPGNPCLRCFDLRRLTSWTTPAEEFFAFHQTETMRVDAEGWRLRIGGFVERPAELTLADLLRRPDRRELAATLECSGNSGAPAIMNGLVSTGVWTGVGLAGLLRECGVQSDAREVVFFGRDAEQERDGTAEVSVPHGRSLPVADALAADGLLAYALNGRPLPPEQGFPLRLVLPGWYGMAQIKWLTRIQVIDRRYEGRHMARNYHSRHALETPEGTLWMETSIARNNLKSVVARVTRRRAGDGFSYCIAGAAWGGRARIETVEVQIDGGLWRTARIDERHGDSAWLLWSYDWKYAATGRHLLVSRAMNARGEVQPTAQELRKRLASGREDHAQWPRAVLIA